MILALDICDSHPEACAAPIDVTRLQTDGVWSREKQNNPFADYYKVMFFWYILQRLFFLNVNIHLLFLKGKRPQQNFFLQKILQMKAR